RPGGTGGDLAVGARGDSEALVGRHRARGDVRRPARHRRPATAAADGDRWTVPRRRLDGDRLARDDGGRRAVRLPRRRGDLAGSRLRRAVAPARPALRPPRPTAARPAVSEPATTANASDRAPR